MRAESVIQTSMRSVEEIVAGCGTLAGLPVCGRMADDDGVSVGHPVEATVVSSVDPEKQFTRL